MDNKENGCEDVNWIQMIDDVWCSVIALVNKKTKPHQT
jgi:hypothetical protein